MTIIVVARVAYSIGSALDNALKELLENYKKKVKS